MNARSLVILAGLALCGPAFAQAQPADASRPADDVLRGPRVREGSVPGEMRSLTGTPQGRYAVEIPHRAFIRAVGTLRGPEAPEGLALTPEQDQALRQADRDFRQSQMDYLTANREELTELAGLFGIEIGEGPAALRSLERLREAARTRPDARPRPAADAPMADAPMADAPMADAPMADDDRMMAQPSPDELAAARQRLRELFDAAPGTRDARVRAWAVLTPGQQAHVEAQLKQFQDEQMAQRRRAALGDQADPQRPGFRPVTDANDPRLPERLRERLAGMTEEDRRVALERINERMRNAAQAPADQPRRQRQDRDPKPPPSMDEVPVPADAPR